MIQISAEQDQFQLAPASCALSIPSRAPSSVSVREWKRKTADMNMDFGRSRTYLNVRPGLIDLDRFPKGEYPLRQVGKLPRIPNAIQEGGFSRRLNCLGLHLLPTTFSAGRHHLPGEVDVRSEGVLEGLQKTVQPSE